MKYSRTGTVVLTSLVAMASGLHAPAASAGPYVLPDVPLIVSVRSIPNVWFQLDDSGSMDTEILAQPVFNACNYDSVLLCEDKDFFVVPEDGKFFDWTGGSSSGEADMDSFEYVFALSDHSYGGPDCPSPSFGNSDDWDDALDQCRSEEGTTASHRGTTVPYRQDWRARSPSVNVMYFNPALVYRPWVNSNDAFTDASFTSARSWPVPGENGYAERVNLAGMQYNIWIDDKGFKGSTPNPTAEDVSYRANSIVDEWDSYIRVTINSSSSFTCEKVTHQPQTYAWHNTKPSLRELRGINPGAVTLATDHPDCRMATAGLTAAQLSQSAANWFQYFRRRTHVARAAVGNVVGELPEFRYGTGSINQSSVYHPIPPAEITDYAANNRQMLDVLYGTNRTTSSTPLRRGLDWVGDYLAEGKGSNASPIIEYCQKNFTLLFSDGYWNGSTPGSPDYDVDRDSARLRNSSVLLADVARYHYNRDLRPDLPDGVPTDAWDARSSQHMVTYTLGFGVKGTLVDTDNDGWPNPPLDTSDNWTVNGNENQQRVDDLWHAAWNARGQYFSADRPEDLFADVAAALYNIGSRFGGAASAAANSGSISSESKIFQAKFDTGDWHGELLAFPVSNDGTLDGPAVWDANALLSARSDAYLRSNAGGRDVFTWNNGNNSGIPFEWNSLTSAQKLLLQGSQGTALLGQQRLQYVRGDSSQERKRGGAFRNREHKMGDIVNSDPVFVGYPPFYYPFDNYQSFFAAQSGRTPVIYFGANDGMFHAVRETDGQQLFAYVPDKVIRDLPLLTDPAYRHEFYVDGPAEYGDVQIDGQWASVVAGGLRAGGQGVFALDVTNPDSFSASNVLWEFSDEDDPDLGYTFGTPQIKRMANGKWAVIIGSGLNNSEEDGNASTTGTGAVFILFIEDGRNGWSSSDYVKLTVPGGSTSDPNAIHTVAATDIDGDFRVDTIYAGDRFGKMWKLDVSSSTTGEWGVAFNGEPLFDAGVGHPITDRPAIAAHPYGRHLGQLVIFGTGQYIQYADNTSEDQPTQSIYAIWDLSPELAAEHSDHGYLRSQLSQGSFTVQSNVRVMGSDTVAKWLDEDGDPDDRGWFIDLPEDGERIRRRPALRNDIVFFVTMTPDDDPCAAGGTGWIMALDTLTGLSATSPVFDIDADKDITVEKDTVVSGDNQLVPAGVRSASIPNLPAFIYDDRPDFSHETTVFPPEPNSPRGCGAGSARAYTFTTQANGSIVAIETATEFLSCGRQSWRLVR